MNLAWILAIAAVIVVALIVGVVVRKRRSPAASPTDLYIQALDALLESNETMALELLKQTVRGDSNNVHAYIKLGILFRKRGEVGRAVRIHREITLRPRVDRVTIEDALQELALDYAAQGNLQKALATLEDLRNRNPKNPFAYEAAVQLLDQQEAWDESYELRKQLQRIRGGRDGQSLAVFQAHVGRTLAERGERKAAQDHFKEAFRRDKHNLAAHIYSGDLKYQDGKLEDAIGQWKNVVRFDPEHASWVYGRLEKAYFDLGQFETMVDVYEEVLQTHPDDVPTLLALARLEHKKGDLEATEKTVFRVLDRDPEHRVARLYLSLIHAERSDCDAAAKALGELLHDEVETIEAFVCRNCGHRADEVLWRCPRCGAWETFTEADR